MNKLFKLLSLVLICSLCLFVNDAEAQRGKKKKSTKDEYFDESGGFGHKLWYGGMVNFNAGGGQMLIGISPMVGYKINDIFSIGPRLAIDYREWFDPGTNPRLIIWGVGPFARAKVLPSVFAHIEYEVVATSSLNDVTPDFISDNNFYLGAGYSSSSGGGFGYEILALYNFLEQNENTVPITFRVGFTWNF